MGVIWTSKTRARQPNKAADPAWGNPLTQGTATGLLPVDGALYETARRVVRKPYMYGSSNDLGIQVGSGMRSAAQIVATSDFWDLEPGTPDPTTGPYCAPSLEFTFLVLCKRFGNPAGGAPIFGNLAPSVSPYYCWGVANSGSSIEVALNCTGTLYSTPSTPMDTGLNCIVARRRIVGGTSDVDVWINGTLRSTQSVGTGAISYFTAGSTRGAALGNFYKYTGETRSFNGEIYLAWIWTRALAEQEIVEVYRNPWQLFAPERKPIFYSLGVSGSTVTGVGSIIGAGTASGVGASTAASVGSTTGTGTASGVGSSASSGTGVGSASGTGSATGVGASTAAAVGSTSGTGTATGVGANGTVTISAVGSASGFSVVLGVSPSRGGGTGKGQNLSRKQKKKLKAVESQEWLKAEETARQLLNDRFTKQTPQEKAQALETYVDSLKPVIEALKELVPKEEATQKDIKEVIPETEHQQIIKRFDTLITKMSSIEELLVIMLADL